MTTGSSTGRNVSIYYARLNFEGSKWKKLYQEGTAFKKQVIRAIAKSEDIRRYWRRGDDSGNEAGYITWFNINENDPEYKRMLESWEGDVSAGEENPYAGHIAWYDFIEELNREGVYEQEARNLAGAIPRIIGSANTYKRFYEDSIWDSIFKDMSEVRGLIMKVDFPGTYESAPDIYEPGTMSFSVFGNRFQEEKGPNAKEVVLTEYVKGQENPFGDTSLTAFSELRGDVEANQDLVRFYKGNTQLKEGLRISGFGLGAVSLGVAAVGVAAAPFTAGASLLAAGIIIAGLGIVHTGLSFGAEVAYASKSEEEKRIMESYEFSYREFLDANVMAEVDSEVSGKSREEKLADYERLKKYGGEGGPGKRARQLRQEAYEMYGDPTQKKGRRGLRIAQQDLTRRRNEIELLLPGIIKQAVFSWPAEIAQNFKPDNTASSIDLSMSENENIWSYPPERLAGFLPFEVKAATKRLMVSLLGQPNSIFAAYDLLEDHYNENRLNRKAVRSLNEYIDQSYWRFVPDDAALANWKIVLHDQSPDLPKETMFRLKKSAATDEWISQLLKIAGAITASGKNPGQVWLEQQAREGKANLSRINADLKLKAEEGIKTLGIPEPGAVLQIPGVTIRPSQASTSVSPSQMQTIQYPRTSDMQAARVMASNYQTAMSVRPQTTDFSYGTDGSAQELYAGSMAGVNLSMGLESGPYAKPATYDRYFYPQEQNTYPVQTALYPVSQNQPPAPQIVHRFEKGSVQVHTQRVDKQALGNLFIKFLKEYSTKAG